MAFTPNGVRVPSAFAKPGQKNKYVQLVDRLVTVVSYDLAKASVLVEDGEGRKFNVSVDKQSVARAVNKERSRAEQGPIAQWSGYAVDERMQAAIPVGSKMILERTQLGRSTKVGNETIYTLEASWIHNVTDPAPNKTFEGLFSVSAYKGRILAVQAWNEKAISANDEESLAAIAAELDENYDATVNKKQYRPGLGVQFRVVVPGASAKDPMVVIDTTLPFDWFSGEKDTAGRVIKEGEPLSGRRFREDLDQYINDYVNVKFKEQYPNLQVEVLSYVNYMAAKLSAKMALPQSEYDPLNKLANTETRLALDDTYTVKMKNVAVKGIVELTSDGVDRAKKEFFERNMVKALHAHGLIGNVQSWVRTADGQKAVPHQGLKVMRMVDDNSNGNASQAPDSAPSVGTDKTEIGASMAASDNSVFSGVDPFESASFGGNDFGVSQPTVETPAPPVSAPASTAKEEKSASIRRRAL